MSGSSSDVACAPAARLQPSVSSAVVRRTAPARNLERRGRAGLTVRVRCMRLCARPSRPDIGSKRAPDPSLPPKRARLKRGAPAPGPPVKVLVVIEASPWGGSRAVTALRLVRALLADGMAVDSVHFRGDGVYHALPGRTAEPGVPDLHAAWRELAAVHEFPLLLCSSAAIRRLDSTPPAGFREAGLTELLERAAACARVLTF
jgi:sulfur relay (sulfurtransferase) complex TusBCD TusD component (DsrE family)